MTSELTTWDRNDYVDGGGLPFLFYVIFGDVDFTAPLSSSIYRCAGVPEGIDTMSYSADEHADVLDSFRTGYLWDPLVETEPELAQTVAQSRHCTILRGTPTDAATLNYLRDTVGLITYMLDNGGCAVHDLLMLRWWHPEEWKQTIFAPAQAVPHEHTVILISEESDSSLHWYHTRGMLKFGRPDISVHNVSAPLEPGVIELCNRLIEHQAFGAVVPDGQPITMAALPPGLVIHHAGDMDDPDFNNVHLDVRWPDTD